MNILTAYGRITDPANFNNFKTKNEDGVFATVVIKKYQGNDSQDKAIYESVFIKFAAYGKNAELLNKLEKGARVFIDLTPYNFTNEIEGKKYQTTEFRCKRITVIDWPDSDNNRKDKK